MNGSDDPHSNGTDSKGPQTGPIAWMARNGVAANLLMLFLLVAGIVSALDLEQEVLPEFTLDIIEVRVRYPGATPQEIEDGVIKRIEERIEGVEGIDEITATAYEGVGMVRAELELGEDVDQRRDEIEAEIGRITSFPEDIERPEITELTSRQRVMELAIWGDTDLRSLKELAYRVEDELSRKPEISYVTLAGVKDYEISIEVPRDRLRAHGLTLADVASAVRRSSLDLPAGDLETNEEEMVIRVEGQRYRGDAFEDIIVVTTEEGDSLRLRDIAKVDDGFTDDPVISRFNGEPAVYVQIFRSGDEQVLEIADAVDRYLEHELPPILPPGVHATLWQDDSRRLESRFELLLKNAAIGLVLVVITLTLFLDLRLALWTAAGILVSFVGTFVVMRVLDVSINMLTLFGFILAIGIVVDDAIVVGENIFSERDRHDDRIESAIRGAKRVATPVIFAVSTTILAFVPMLFVPGTTGKFLGSIPIVVIGVLSLSLVESLLVLPHHLGVLRRHSQNKIVKVFDRVQGRVDRALGRFIDGPLARGLRFSTRHPMVVLSAGLAALMICVSIVASGLVKIMFFPDIESEFVTASVEMPSGTTASSSFDVAQHVADVGRNVASDLNEGLPEEEPDLVRNVVLSVGRPPIPTGPPQEQMGVLQASTASVVFHLSSPEERSMPAAEFEQAWRDAVGEMTGVESLSFSSNLVSFGADVQIELSVSEEERLDGVVRRVQDELRSMEGVYDVRNDREQGKREFELDLRDRGRALGLTLQGLGSQLRAAFFGEEAQRIQRGPEEVKVYVRLPKRERDAIEDLYGFRIRTPQGVELPLREVAEISEGRSPTTIERRGGRRIATVFAQVDPSITTGSEVSERLAETLLAELEREVEGLSYEFGGERREQQEAIPALRRNFLLALLAIYSVLAISFRSYGQAIVIMASIPFGFVGAIVGHLALGLDVTILSMFGIVGLSGVIVNDALVMIDFVNERLERGEGRRAAIVKGAQSRFRPIILTSLTTFLGVFPLVTEQSIQARFLVPLAVSIGFGVLVGTLILMFVVSALAELHLRRFRPGEARATPAGAASETDTPTDPG